MIKLTDPHRKPIYTLRNDEADRTIIIRRARDTERGPIVAELYIAGMYEGQALFSNCADAIEHAIAETGMSTFPRKFVAKKTRAA